jgi:hypothetical protein
MNSNIFGMKNCNNYMKRGPAMNRKKILTLILITAILILALLMTSCKFCPLAGIARSAGRNIESAIESSGLIGSGDIKTEERDIKSIDSVVLETIGTLYIEQSDEYSLSVEAEDNILPVIVTNVMGDSLRIGMERGISLQTTKGVKYFLTVKDLDLISTTSSGDIVCENIETEKLELNVSSSGSIEIIVDVEDLDIKISSSGNIIASGKTEDQDINISSSGDYEAGDLISSRADINISSSGDATVNVSDYLDVNISSSGDVYFKGNPETDFSSSSSGKMESID